jgi:hypothetical protein
VVSPIMPDALAKETGTSVTPNTEAEDPAEPATGDTSSAEHEKRRSTSNKELEDGNNERKPSLHSQSSSPLPKLAPVLGAVALVSESTAASASKQHPSPPLAHSDHVHDGEKHTHVTAQENGSTGIRSVALNDGKNAGATTGSGEEDDEIIYPGGFQLGILTFGLCMATFVIALDNTIIGK